MHKWHQTRRVEDDGFVTLYVTPGTRPQAASAYHDQPVPPHESEPTSTASPCADSSPRHREGTRGR